MSIKNKSYCYLLPLLDIPRNLLDSLLNTYRKNSEAINKTMDNELLLCFNKRQLMTTEANYLTKLDNHVEFIMYDEYVLLKYRIDDLYLSEIDKFNSGKYSEFLNTTKNKILSYWFSETDKTIIESQPLYKILYPSEKDMVNLSERLGIKKDTYEISSKPSIIEETFFNNVEFLKLVK